jgi:hypothetical protein
MPLRIARLLIFTGALALPAGLVACGSDSSSSSTPASTESAESAEENEAEEGHEVVPDSEVTAGLAELEKMGVAVVVATAAGNGSTDDVDAMFEKWATFEGTIKQNEVDLYLTMEDSLSSLRSAADDGDGAAATAAMASLSEASATYLSKHP